MNEGNDGLIRDGGVELCKSRDDDAGLVGERQSLPEIVPQRSRDVVHESVRNLHVGFEGAREVAALYRLQNDVAARGYPHAASRQFVFQIGKNAVVGSEDEADQPRGGQNRAGNDAGPLRFVPRQIHCPRVAMTGQEASASDGAASASSSPATGASTQPALTRASITMASASVRDSSKPSR